jgi:hypothetical protein
MKRVLLGRKRDLHPNVFHKVSLIALLAWVGLGADGLSSSAYGPEEAFKTLGAQTYLAVGLALATAFTVLVISYAYSRIIEQFSARRRRLRRGLAAPGATGRGRVGVCPGGGLCAHDLHLHRRGGRCDLQLSAACVDWRRAARGAARQAAR